jgi:hypothetical protein
MYKGFEYGRGIRSASQIFNSAVSTRGTLNPENAINTYREANEARFRVMREMYRNVENMRALGMSDGEIRRAMKKNKVANISELMRGEFVPMKVSSEIRRRVRENDNQLPLGELNSIRYELMRRPLDEPIAPEEAPASDFDPSRLVPVSEAPAPTEPVAATTPPPVAAQAGAATAPSAASAPTSMANAITLPNPQDQILAARLRGQ